MRAILLLTAANLRKGKHHMISLIGLVFIAALFLNLGLVFVIKLGSFYEERAKAQNSAHGMVILQGSAYERGDREYFENTPNVTAVQNEEVLMLEFTKFAYGVETMTRSIVLYDFDVEREISRFQLIGPYDATAPNGIYLPLAMKSGGYRLGSELVLTYKNEPYTFIVAGFVEDMYFGSTIKEVVDMYMPSASYQRFVHTLNDSSLFSQVISIRMKDGTVAANMLADYNDYVSDQDENDSPAVQVSIDLADIQSTRTSTPNIISSLLVAFSFIIVAVCLIVVRFRIVSNIQDSMTHIGVQKALGYISGQIIAAVVFQFGGIAAIAAVAGILGSFFTTPVLANVFAEMIGLNWEQEFDPCIAAVSFLIITGAVVLVSILSALRINQLHPILALRGEGAARTFKHNFFPLHQTQMNLQIALSLKREFQKLKQNLMILLILIGVSYTMMFTIVLYYNFVVDNAAFYSLSAEEPSNVRAEVDEYSVSLLEHIRRMPEVSRAVYRMSEGGQAMTSINREALYPVVMDDFSESKSALVIKGRHPKTASEIAFPAVLAEQYSQEIGDAVTVKIGEKEEDYTICGLTQSLGEGGRRCALTLAGYKRLESNFDIRTIYIELNPYENTKAFISILEDELGERVLNTINVDDMMSSSMGMFVTIAQILSIVIFMTSVLVVMLVLYLIIQTNIAQRRREFGIQKSIGFTTIQLMHQISIGLTPVVVSGSILGGLAGLFSINPFLSLLFASEGIMKSSFTVHSFWVTAMVLMMAVFSYAAAMSIAWRIRKISPYDVLAGE